jgi:hypothetical protein
MRSFFIPTVLHVSVVSVAGPVRRAAHRRYKRNKQIEKTHGRANSAVTFSSLGGEFKFSPDNFP